MEKKFDKLLQRYENSIKSGIYTLEVAADLLFIDHMKLIDEEIERTPVEPIQTPEGYEIWKYDIETFEPIFRKKQ